MTESNRRQRLIVELDRTRSELAAAERRAGVLDERERLAREIHDTLAQGLSSIQLLLQAATRSLAPSRQVDPARAADLVAQARQQAQANLVEARRFVRALAPPDLEGSSLEATLKRLCDTTSAGAGIRVTFHGEGDSEPLATPVEVALLRIAQAALANTVQHARATRADVTLTNMTRRSRSTSWTTASALIPNASEQSPRRTSTRRLRRPLHDVEGHRAGRNTHRRVAAGSRHGGDGPSRPSAVLPAATPAVARHTRRAAAMSAIRVLLADDHPVVRAGLRAVLESEPDLSVNDDVATAEAAVERPQAGDIDVVLMDLQFGDGLDCPGRRG
jgi:hypothetical protein